MNLEGLVSELVAHGFAPDVAHAVPSWIDAAHARNQPQEAWARLYRDLLTPAHDFSLHLALYRACYGPDAPNRPDAPAWLPTPDVIDRANVTAFGRELGLSDYPALHRWSVLHPGRYWEHAIKRLGIRLRQ